MKKVSVLVTSMFLLMFFLCPVILSAQTDESELTDDQIIQLQKQELYLITDIQAQEISIIKQVLVMRQNQLREKNARIESEIRDENYAALSDSEKVALLRFLHENLDKTNEQLAKTQELLRQAQALIDKRNAGQPVSNEEMAAFQNGSKGVRYSQFIHFGLGSVVLTREAKRILTEFDDSLSGQQNYQLQVVGHTDNIPFTKNARGRYRNNWELSVARAVAVAEYLINQKNVDPKYLIVGGKSKYDPLTDDDTPEGRKNNRRVELILTPR
jgi:chemotaxis protein MotB